MWLRYHMFFRNSVGIRVESGSHPLTHLTHRIIRMWPTYDPHVELFFLKVANVTWLETFLIWNNAIDFFILGRIQYQSLAQTSWRWNLWKPHASIQLEIMVSHQSYFSAFIRPKVHSLTRCQGTTFILWQL